MNISLGLLIQLDACAEARKAFKQRFGEDGDPTALEVFTAAAELKRPIGWSGFLTVSPASLTRWET